MRRRQKAALLLIATTIGLGTSALASSSVAGAQGDDEWALLNDTPAYSFGSGGAPVRNAPLAIAVLRGSKTGSGLELDITNVASFVPTGTAISARIGFYSAPTRRPMIYGGFEFSLSGDGAVEGTLVERESEGTTTSAEVWGPADEDFGEITGRYASDGAGFRISATGAYRKLLRDPLTTVGFDLWTGDAGTTVQPSARVSIGDLTGVKPGLLPLQGTSVAADGTPQPWITGPVAKDFYKWRVSVTTEAENPQLVNIDIGKYSESASQIRLFVANQFNALPAGSSFPPYDLVLFGPDDTSVRARSGDAFASSEIGAVEIKRGGKGKFTLELDDQLHAGFAAAQVVVQGQDNAVLLATGFQVKF
ncbi:MAG: hypothetical protein WEA75_03105 [Acidimicrobiia bacterium]